jgi:ribose-phosphate pyrophosphokinase
MIHMVNNLEAIKIFAGEASAQLGRSVCDHLKIPLGEIYQHTFPSGEKYCQLKENVRGADVFLLQSTHLPCNDNLMQLLVMADAARRASAGRITAVIPYFGYSRQDRKDKPRVPITAKLVMDMLAAAGIQRVITMDLHAQQLQGFTNLPVDHLYFRPSLSAALKGKNIEVIVSPDLGAVKKASEYADKEGLDIAFIVKKRTNDTTVEVTQFVGDVKGKRVLILDDLTESAGTILAAAKQCRAHGASEVYAAVTHACLSKVGKERLNNAIWNLEINNFYCSNTVTELPVGKNDTGIIVNVADIFAKAIMGTHTNEGITSLFK